MAEFQEVMKQKKRMCDAFRGCSYCPVYTFEEKQKSHLLCTEFTHRYPDVVEHIVMEWASENPEPVYPTWIEWWNENFNGEGRRMLQPCCFVPPRDLGCNPGHDGCMVAPYKCWHTPIPANIAEKLGIKPIEGGKSNV